MRVGLDPSPAGELLQRELERREAEGVTSLLGQRRHLGAVHRQPLLEPGGEDPWTAELGEGAGQDVAWIVADQGAVLVGERELADVVELLRHHDPHLVEETVHGQVAWQQPCDAEQAAQHPQIGVDGRTDARVLHLHGQHRPVGAPDRPVDLPERGAGHRDGVDVDGGQPFGAELGPQDLRDAGPGHGGGLALQRLQEQGGLGWQHAIPHHREHLPHLHRAALQQAELSNHRGGLLGEQGLEAGGADLLGGEQASDVEAGGPHPGGDRHARQGKPPGHGAGLEGADRWFGLAHRHGRRHGRGAPSAQHISPAAAAPAQRHRQQHPRALVTRGGAPRLLRPGPPRSKVQRAGRAAIPRRRGPSSPWRGCWSARRG